MYLLIGSSSSDNSSVFSRRIESSIPDFEARGISGASVGSWITKVTAEPVSNYRGQDVLVYLPGQTDFPSIARVNRLNELLLSRGALSVAWILPPKFPDGVRMRGTDISRESVVGGTARAIVGANVTVLNPSRLTLIPRDVAGDGIHLTAAGQARLADSVLSRLALRPGGLAPGGGPSPGLAPSLAAASSAMLIGVGLLAIAAAVVFFARP